MIVFAVAFVVFMVAGLHLERLTWVGAFFVSALMLLGFALVRLFDGGVLGNLFVLGFGSAALLIKIGIAGWEVPWQIRPGPWRR